MYVCALIDDVMVVHMLICAVCLCVCVLGYNETITALESLRGSTDAAVNGGRTLDATLMSIAAQVTAIMMECTGNATLSSQCDILDPSIFVAGADFSQVTGSCLWMNEREREGGRRERER